MTEFFSRLFDSGQAIPALAIAGSMVIAIIAILGGMIAKCWCHSREIAFKEEMIARGMSAEEIRTVIEAGSRRPFPHAGCRDADAAPHVG
jgi:hypothetical protein